MPGALITRLLGHLGTNPKPATPLSSSLRQGKGLEKELLTLTLQ